MVKFHQLYILVWKNAVLQRRQIVSSVIQILIPALLVIILGFTTMELRNLIPPVPPRPVVPEATPVFWTTDDIGEIRYSVPTVTHDSLGSLNSTCDGVGLLGEIHQQFFWTQDKCFPFFAKEPSATAVDDAIVAQLMENERKSEMADWAQHVITTGMDFTEYRETGDTPKLAVTLQIPADVAYIDTGSHALTLENMNLVFMAFKDRILESVRMVAAIATFPFMLPGFSGGFNLVSGTFVLQLVTFLFGSFTYVLVHEKSHKLLAFMSMAGVSRFLYFLSWYIVFFAMYAIVCAVVLGGLAAFQIDIVMKNGILPVCLFLLIWGHNMVGQAFLYSLLFTSAKAAVAIAILIVLIGPFIFAVFASMTAHWFMHAFPMYTFLRGLQPMCALAPIIQPRFVSNAEFLTSADSAIVDMRLCMLILLVSGFAYFALAWYLSFVLPQKWSVRRHPLFFLRMRRSGPRRRTVVGTALIGGTSDEDEDVAEERARAAIGGPASGGEEPAIRMVELERRFGMGFMKADKVAVDSMSLAVDYGECFGLLGANGAGKTTTISMLAGLLSPSGGEAFVAGMPLVEQTSEVQLRLGICPQFDVLWPDLTCSEHVTFFARLRGMSSRAAEDHFPEILAKVHLADSAKKKVKHLSGGMCRRLSIAMSLSGDAPILLLDEPTTGLDVSSRRDIWDLILSLKSDRAVVLTTHSMEEAEALCGRIGIMTKGRLRCLGSPLHLSAKFGSGWRLALAAVPGRQAHALAAICQRYPTATVSSALGAVTTIRIPDKGVLVSKLFADLETHKTEFGIRDWALTRSSLEDVFVNLVKEDDA